MSEENKPQTGMIAWTDLTVENADAVRDFYEAVVGWAPDAVSMGDYSDYSMTPPGAGLPVAGICHARGVNEGLPPVWMMYIMVDDLEESIEAVKVNGGKTRTTIRDLGPTGRYCVIEDPAGAVAALFQTGS
jgi:predicted enzyme related to lactoylglutathione lyase